MAELNIHNATEQPDDLVFSTPDITKEEYPYISRVIYNQNWSSIMALGLIMQHENDLRDNDNMSGLVADTLSGFIDNTINDSDLEDLYLDSSSRRSDIDLEPISEDIYKKERDPRLLKNFAYDTIIASGLEKELHDDIIEGPIDESIVKISDTSVDGGVVDGDANEEIKQEAENIAIKLGLQVETSDLNNKNLIVSEPFELDSTDSYVKKVTGNV